MTFSSFTNVFAYNYMRKVFIWQLISLVKLMSRKARKNDAGVYLAIILWWVFGVFAFLITRKFVYACKI
ncbi:hypothetical protein ASE23_20925 [Rhizobium sp. Root73]|nr:hypothetical protein ASD36_23595 [Rhizobium sp. Root1334]KRC12807.1 hypothetical protein ASE23_20925 [Rhizobium sp. Root73]